jgi:hypothetical protein
VASAFLVLANMSGFHSDNGKPLPEAAAGITAALAALRLHRANNGIQMACTKVLANLLGNFAIMKVPVAIEGLVTEIVSAMGVRGCAVEVLISGADAIMNLGANSAIALQPHDVRASISALAGALKAYPKAAELQKSAISALGNLAEAKFDVREHMAAMGCVNGVIAAFKAFPDLTGFRVFGCKVLRYVAEAPELRKDMVAAGAMQVLKACLKGPVIEIYTGMHAAEGLKLLGAGNDPL